MESSEVFTIPDELPVIYLTDTVIHPYAVMPLSIQKEESKAAIHHAGRDNRLIVAVRAHETDSHSFGTLCRVAKQRGMPDGSLQVIVQGLERVRLGKVVQEDPFYTVSIVRCPDSEAADETTTAMQETAIAQFLRLARFLPDLPAGIINAMSSLETPLQASSVIATFLPMSSLQQQQILEADAVQEKFAILMAILTQELARVENELKKQTAGGTEEEVLPKILFGKESTTGKDITLFPKQFDLGGYLIGTRRQGKSTLLEHLIMQSIRYKNGVCLIDPHGDLLQQICHRMPQKLIDEGHVILLDPKDYLHPFGLNIYHCEDKNDPVAVEYTTNLVMDIYKKLWKSEYSQPMVEDIIFMTTLTIIANDMTMVEVPKLLFDDAFRKHLVKNVRNPDVLDFWKIYDNPKSIEREQGGGTVGRRLRRFTSSGILRYIVGQSEKAIRFRDILDSKKIVLIRLYSDLPELTSLIGSTIISQMLQAALSRSDTDERPINHLYCDEYSRFATESFAQIIAEAGKYNLIPFIAHQSTGQISEENQDSAIQLGSLIAFRLIGKDGERIADEFSLNPSRIPPTIPRNVLDYIDRHPSDSVKDFAGTYILWLHNALRKKEKHGSDPDYGSYDIDPYHNFGEGKIWFQPDQAQEALNNIERLLYETMRQETIAEKELIEVIADMAPLLRYTYYYTCYYMQDSSQYEKSEKAIRSEADKLIAEKEPKIAELREQINLNDYDLAWQLSGQEGKRTKEEVWAGYVEQAAMYRRGFPPTVQELLENFKNPKYLALRSALEEWEKNNDRASRKEMQRFAKLWKMKVPPLIPNEDEEEVEVDLSSGRATVSAVRKALSSDDELYAFVAAHDYGTSYYKKSKEEIVAMFTEIAERNKETLETRGTPEKLVDRRRTEMKEQLEKLENEIEKAKITRDLRLTIIEADHRTQMETEKARHDRFLKKLVQVLNILQTPKGKIEATPTIITPQQTYADRRNQIANELVQLKRGQARVKLPTGEYLIETIPSTTSHADSPKKAQIIEHTRKKYCRPRSEVEEEIRRRQEIHEPPPPTRKHTV